MRTRGDKQCDRVSVEGCKLVPCEAAATQTYRIGGSFADVVGFACDAHARTPFDDGETFIVVSELKGSRT